MDVAALYTIPYKSLKIGEHTLEFRFDDSLFAAYENTDIRHAEGCIGVVLQRGESMLELRVAIRGSVVVPCDRCLDDCTLPVVFDGTLVVKFSDQVEDYDGEVMWISPSAGSVDLTQYMYESILLSLPYQRVHPDGECDPGMLARFRIVTGEEFDRLEQAAQRQEGSIRGLEELRRKMEQQKKKG